ncbi:hemophore-related protein [Gordonia polyisoprenivorans]|uniref:hemophore-related protein n=1 Tax=Gordonia polyisoprenivorans TaxID=84595 RepID=UPI001AD673B0|nr:hemophore-related protein [Gordonia polyisoprenivorans]QTI68166.1 hemophore-related protein [Gordonia polyisoprenivorans]
MSMGLATTRRRVTVAVAGIGIAGVVGAGGAGIAGAAPTPPPPPKAFGTTCSVMQVERALAVEDPALWQQINSHPRAKRHFEEMIVLSPEQRKALREKNRHAHPVRSTVMAFLRDHGIGAQQRTMTRDAMAKALRTCNKF